ncbi:transposase, partial [Bradyrhizobium sp. Gha]|uniref:transposase n=4 Tax=Bradyrhizobium sp. Gha TaxID=1855318 RepID=UPI0011606A9E
MTMRDRCGLFVAFIASLRRCERSEAIQNWASPKLVDTYSLGRERCRMAKRQRRSYSDEYKGQAVDLVLSSGRSAKSVSKELGLDGSVLSRWVKERSTVAAGGSAAAPTSQASVPSADQADVIARLQRENEQLRMERDILKKSIA